MVEIVPTALPNVLLIKPRVWTDARGFFLESWNESTVKRAGLDVSFRQDNHSRSVRNVVRGLHYQLNRPQGRVVRYVRGAVFDVAVDLRRSASTFGRWLGVELSKTNHDMLWIPPGFGHGLVVLSDAADVHYKASEPYDAKSDRAILWNDLDLAIKWPLAGAPIVSAKDASACALSIAALRHCIGKATQALRCLHPGCCRRPRSFANSGLKDSTLATYSGTEAA